MKRLFGVMVTVFCVVLAGCAATVERPSAQAAERLDIPVTATSNVYLFVQSSRGHGDSEDWELFRTEWRTAMAASAEAAGRRFVYLDTLPARFEEAGVLVIVDVNDYRYLSPGARYGFGAMTGNAYIDADAAFYVLPGRTPAGTRKYSTSSSAWQGIFSAMTAKQVAAITDEMLREIGGG